MNFYDDGRYRLRRDDNDIVETIRRLVVLPKGVTLRFLGACHVRGAIDDYVFGYTFSLVMMGRMTGQSGAHDEVLSTEVQFAPSRLIRLHDERSVVELEKQFKSIVGEIEQAAEALAEAASKASADRYFSLRDEPPAP